MRIFSQAIRTKIVLCIIVTIIFLLGCLAATMMHTKTSGPVSPSPEHITAEFYSWYLHNIDKVSDTSIDEPNMRQYTTTELRHQLDLLAQLREMELTVALTDEQYNPLEFDELMLDSDYFTKAQACFEDWADNIKISSADILNNSATVNVSSKDPPQNDCPLNLSVNLIKEDNLWKIRSVTNSEKK